MPEEDKKEISVEELMATLIVTIEKLNKKLDGQEQQKTQDQDIKYEILRMVMESRKEEREWDRMLQLISVIGANNGGGNWQRRYR